MFPENLYNDLSHFNDTDFFMMYLIHWMLFFYFNPFKEILAWNRLKSLILTNSKVLRNICWVWNILDFNSRTHLIIVHSLEIYPKLLSFTILYFCTFFKMLQIASLTFKKRICDVLRSISDKMVNICWQNYMTWYPK